MSATTRWSLSRRRVFDGDGSTGLACEAFGWRFFGLKRERVPGAPRRQPQGTGWFASAGGMLCWLSAFVRGTASGARSIPLIVLIGSFCRVVAQNAPTPPRPPQLPIPGITVSGEPGELGLSMQILLLLTLLTLLPAAIASLTPFLRLVIVLHFLRQAVGTQTAPSNQTLLGLALFLTIVLMQPVADQVHAEAIVPLQNQEIGQWEALEKAQGPIKQYLSRYVREQDVALFLDVTKQQRPRNLDDLNLTVLMPAYVLSELRIGFQIGAVLFLPFLVIDLLVASITLSLGMIQLPPVMISVPFKLLLFVLVDGWNLVVGSLVRGF
jgi:flagellar biosynthetic protein FliP